VDCDSADRQRPSRNADGSFGRHGPRHPRRLSGRWPAHGGAAGRLQRGTRRQQLGDRRQRDEHSRGQGHLGGGAWSLYTDWEQDGSKQWETFLANELPDWLAANKGLAPSGHGIVGAAQGGTGALTIAAFHPDRYRFAGSLSGFLTPSNTYTNGAITAGLAQFGGVDTRNMWGLPQLGRWKWHDPDVHVQLLADNNTRLWVMSPSTLGCSDPAAMIGYCDQAQGSNRTFYQHYRNVGGHNGHFDFPDGPQHDWGTWSGQLGAMSGELVTTIK
jgi:S-formylglutathione hydrolase FrmB